MKYILGAFGIVVLIFVVFLLFISGNGKPAQQQEATQLISFAGENSVVSQTTTGHLVGDDSRRAIRISVSRNERRLEVLAGYDQRVIQSQSYANTNTAYETFLSALGGAGFLSSKKSTLDQRGVCPTGNQYVYDLSVNGEHKSNLWSTSCNKLGTFSGQGTTIRTLFQQQIPDYDKQVQSVKL